MNFVRIIFNFLVYFYLGPIFIIYFHIDIVYVLYCSPLYWGRPMRRVGYTKLSMSQNEASGIQTINSTIIKN